MIGKSIISCYLPFRTMRTSIAFLLVINCYNFVSAQRPAKYQNDSSEDAFDHAIAMYDRNLSRNSSIFTGRGYFDPHNGVKGHQFFIEDYWEFGNVTYDSNTYDSIPLKYDIYEDLLLIENFNSDGFLSPIKLYSKNVREFNLHGYHFIWLNRDSISGLREGFYNLMYHSNKIQVLVKRRKEIISSNEMNSVRNQFSQRDKYYIKKNGRYHKVRKKKTVLKVLVDRKKELKRFIRENHFLFKTNPDVQLVEVVKHYDSL
ncbi:MAG: hypothetical protein MI975_18090 [Cytophagales bacterium]|nr:hypothetical protein [Cytophagales bacterium]